MTFAFDAQHAARPSNSAFGVKRTPSFDDFLPAADASPHSSNDSISRRSSLSSEETPSTVCTDAAWASFLSKTGVDRRKSLCLEELSLPHAVTHSPYSLAPLRPGSRRASVDISRPLIRPKSNLSMSSQQSSCSTTDSSPFLKESLNHPKHRSPLQTQASNGSLQQFASMQIVPELTTSLAECTAPRAYSTPVSLSEQLASALNGTHRADGNPKPQGSVYMEHHEARSAHLPHRVHTHAVHGPHDQQNGRRRSISAENHQRAAQALARHMHDPSANHLHKSASSDAHQLPAQITGGRRRSMAVEFEHGSTAANTALQGRSQLEGHAEDRHQHSSMHHSAAHGKMRTPAQSMDLASTLRHHTRPALLVPAADSKPALPMRPSMDSHKLSPPRASIDAFAFANTHTLAPSAAVGAEAVMTNSTAKPGHAPGQTAQPVSHEQVRSSGTTVSHHLSKAATQQTQSRVDVNTSCTSSSTVCASAVAAAATPTTRSPAKEQHDMCAKKSLGKRLLAKLTGHK